MKIDKAMIPNCITSLRIIGSALLLLAKPFSPYFFIVYTVCGVSDVLDGFLARALNAESETGSILDSISDIMFYSAMLFHIVPYLIPILPLPIWYAVAVILAVRLCAYLIAGIKYRRFASIHTYANKITGGALFCVPYLIHIFDPIAVCSAVCIIGGYASMEEILIHVFSNKYSPNVKSIFLIGKFKNSDPQ